ncbi:hypothetical protein SAMN05216201_10984 [Pseudomonas linyingensis]|uniref:Uncharacterized protein n=1 Tax=Pseudomonas linyingensis TaxID=915471 RepID=A0A1H6Z1X3_9PSED|nr:hypothetical protein [Pseudomonas linyingensis]SEJ46656.1 hypothetical protein SAMN05216201_10984 [Pseudomonas linyingensis]
MFKECLRQARGRARDQLEQHGDPAVIYRLQGRAAALAELLEEIENSREVAREQAQRGQ